MTNVDWKKIAQQRLEKIADMLELLGVKDVATVETPVAETDKALVRMRRDIRNISMEEAAITAADAASTWDAKNGGIDTKTGPRCRAVAAAIRASKETT